MSACLGREYLLFVTALVPVEIVFSSGNFLTSMRNVKKSEISLILCPPYILCTVCNSIFCVLFVAFCREICYVAWKILNQKLRLWRKRANMRYATGGTTRGTTGGGRRKPRAVIGPITQLPPPHSNKKRGLKLGQNITSSQK